jgi:ATP-dependent helicase/nuclease subunit A
MNAPRNIPPQVIEDQLKASDPDVSAWVTANAGSGKTHVLTQRVISLLLKGEDPAKILCITFTKAAAANMASRIFRDLSAWITLDDASLDRKLVDIGAKPGLAMRARARRLFALALETPGGLKVQTIHAFCTRLLHQFPFEADVAARFAVLDDASEHQLLEKLILDVMLEAAASRGSALGQALQIAIAQAADQTLQEVIREAIRKRDLILGWIDKTGSVDAAMGQLSEAFGIDHDDSIERICAECEAEGVPAREWKALAEVFASGKQFDVHQSVRWRQAADAGWPIAIDAYLSIFVRDEDGTAKKDQYVMGKDLRQDHPILWERLAAERERAVLCEARLRAVRYRDKTRALLTLAYEIIRRYRAEKNRRGLLDYDDLIDKTLALFRKTSAAWVLFKLDLGVNHVLIDEAQDTSPKQWEIIGTLVGEFTAGAGARPVKRTLFAVGDDKQSIFSFQGADPQIFAEMSDEFAAAFTNAGMSFAPVPLRTSFRSGPAILGAVDDVFQRPAAHQGLTADSVGTAHQWLSDAPPGCVDIWPLTKPDPRGKPEGWEAPFDKKSETSPQVRLARKIAHNVRLATMNGTKPGDVLILVRQRGALFEAIIRALKAAHIPVAGADRLVLTGHIAVMDLIAFADALLLPDDDLALASVLKSPLFGFDDDELFKVAWDRGRKSLRLALLERSASERKFADAAQTIERLTDETRRLSPFTFYARLLGPGGGRRKFLSRLGPEANDALDEFLNLALDYESRETPSLQGFVAWLRAAQAEVKRDMEQGRDEVRVMTVHGAKGLEAPVVILADTTTRPAGYHPPRLIPMMVNGVEAVVWTGSKTSDPAAVAAARKSVLRASENEYRRLLYVAMTRAQRHLIVCGIAGQATKNDDAPTPDGCWYELIADALIGTPDSGAQSVEINAEDGEGKIWRYLKSQPAPAGAATTPRAGVLASVPAWLTHAAPPEPPRVVPLSPSDAWDEEMNRAPASGVERRKAIQRGQIVHRLMQSLPDIPADRRADPARAYVLRANNKARADDRLTEAECEAIVTRVLSILNDVRFAPLFAAGSRAELPIVGRIARPGRAPRPVSGQVDRLIVTADAVLIADYKTNHAPPRSVDAALNAHPNYVLQLALYRALLQEIYPGQTVHAALVWTETPDLMEIPGHALDEALVRLTSP